MTQTARTIPRPGLLRRMYDWVLSLAERRRSGGWLALLSFTEASFFPIPPDVLLIPLCLGRTARALRFATICTVASVAGGAFGYFIGMHLWHWVGGFFFDYVPGFSPGKFDEVKSWYDEYGVAVVFLAGFSPIPYKLFTIASGVFSMSFVPFLGASLVGRAGRFYLVGLLLARFGEPMKLFIDAHFNRLAFAFGVLLVGGFVVVKWAL